MKVAQLLIFGMLLFATIPGCGSMGSSPSGPPDPAKLPIYPGAQQVNRSKVPGSNDSNTYWLVTFTTSDKPDHVLSYYTNVMTANDWHLDEHSPTYVSFSWTDRQSQPWIAWLTVTTSPSPRGQTSVELRMENERR